MQPTNDPDEENRNVLLAVELYRLQSLRNTLVIILMVQLLLIGVGLTMVFEANRITSTSRQLHSDQSAEEQGHDRFQPGEVYRAPEHQHVVA